MIREYNFITGPETPSLPTASTPTASDDLTTKDYVDKAFAKSVLDLAAIKALIDKSDRQIIYVESLDWFFKYDLDSALAGDDLLVIQPNDSIGRYIRLDNFIVDGIRYTSQDVASTATINALSTSKPRVRITGAIATALNGIDATGSNKSIIIFNAASQDITVKNQNASATATNRIITPSGGDLVVSANTSIEFIYDDTLTRWVIKAGAGTGSGGGGGALVVTSAQTISAGGTVTTSTVNPRQLRYVVSSGGFLDLSLTPFGNVGGWADGTEIILIGTNDDNTLRIQFNDANYGVVGNFSELILTKNMKATLIWDNTNLRWIL